MSETSDIAAAPMAPATPGAHTERDGAIDAWYRDHFSSIPLGWDQELRAHLDRAVADLKQRLRA